MKLFNFIKSVGSATLLGVSIISFTSCSKQEQVQQAGSALVSSIKVEEAPLLLHMELPGRVNASLTAEIRPQVNGLLLERLFKEGDEVKKGDLLYRIDPAPYKAALANAEAQVARADANMANAEAIVQVATAGKETAIAAAGAAKTALQAAKAALVSAEANAEPLRLRKERFKELLKSRAVSQQDYDDIDSASRQAEAGIERAIAAVDGAAAELTRAEAGVKVAAAEVERSKAGLVAAKAEIKAAAAVLTAAKINIDYTEITAPISGKIGRSSITVGALVAAHQPVPLATIQQVDKVFVDVQQATAELLRLQRRLEDGRLSHNGTQNIVKLAMEDGKTYKYEGTLQFRDVTVDQSTGSFTLRMEFPNPDRTLMPGMYVRAILEEGIKEDAVLIPQQTVNRDPSGNAFVMLVDAEETVQVQPVRLDRAIKNQWLVSEGLKSGDRVIIEGLQRIRPGAKVQETAPINPAGNNK